MRVTAVSRIARDSRLLRLAQEELGASALPFRATLFEKTGAANWRAAWHQDTALPLRARFEASGWGPWSEKAGVLYAHAPGWALERVVALRVHLDASTVENGPLRVVPGSNLLGVLEDAEVGGVVERIGFVECPVRQGGVLMMRPLIVHSSPKAVVNAPRRVLHIEYADVLSLAKGIDLAVA